MVGRCTAAELRNSGGDAMPQCWPPVMVGRGEPNGGQLARRDGGLEDAEIWRFWLVGGSDDGRERPLFWNGCRMGDALEF
ncbi:efflux RND transporter periplasmic adaptor subunit [Sesbania bispinosa]|nr:efflux RND transporter periplasmic adaptor subunit [Sesbania bispinosa]